ncbi:MAG: hypothetical protein ACOCV2_04590 [Persicimonas sp.]
MRYDTTNGHRARLLARLAALFFACALVGPLACSGNGGEDTCEGDEDCESGQQCVDGVCEASNPDAGNNDGGSNEVEEEDYYISYTKAILEGGGESYHLMVYSTADEEHTQVSPSGLSCEQGCWLTEDLSHMVWLENNEEGGRDINKAEVNEDFEVESGTDETLATGVSDIDVVGNAATYREETVAYAVNVADGERTEIAVADETEDEHFYADPRNDMAMVFQSGDKQLNLRLGEIGGISAGDTEVTLDGSHYQRTGGSYYGRHMPAAFSPDGDIAAFLTDAPNEYGKCEGDGDCSGPGQKCGHAGVCTVMENTVNFVDTNELDELGQACGGPGTCSADVHECYMPDGEEDTSSAVCIPGRVALGLPDVGDQDGCAETEGDEDYYYSEARGPLSVDSEGNVYLVGARHCDDVDSEVGHSDIVRVDPIEGEHEVVWGNSQEGGFDADDCWDSDANEPSDTDCNPYIRWATLSPEYNQLAVGATNPHVDYPAENVEDRAGLWTVQRDGEEHGWAEGETGSDEAIENINVHPEP